jgi:hypothetical protein
MAGALLDVFDVVEGLGSDHGRKKKVNGHGRKKRGPVQGKIRAASASPACLVDATPRERRATAKFPGTL